MPAIDSPSILEDQARSIVSPIAEELEPMVELTKTNTVVSPEERLPVEKEKKEIMFQVNDETPIYMCESARKRKCSYALCSNCKSVDTENSGEKSRRPITGKYCLDSRKHAKEKLFCWQDKSYFTKKYLDKIEAEVESKWPLNCSVCGVVFTSRRLIKKKTNKTGPVMQLTESI